MEVLKKILEVVARIVTSTSFIGFISRIFSKKEKKISKAEIEKEIETIEEKKRKLVEKWVSEAEQDNKD